MSRTKQIYDEHHYFLESLTNSARSDNDALKSRIIAVKSKMPSGIVPLFVKVYPDFDTEILKLRIRNVLSLRCVDVEITAKLELLESKLNQINKK